MLCELEDVHHDIHVLKCTYICWLRHFHCFIENCVMLHISQGCFVVCVHEYVRVCMFLLCGFSHIFVSVRMY